MQSPWLLRIWVAVTVGLLAAGCERPPMETTQTGYRGTGMVDVRNPRLVEAAGEYPEVLPAAPDTGPRAGEVYQNVQVLGALSVGQFTRLMTAMTAWVSPEEGCNYCHLSANLASDDIYTKVVSRRMIEMTRDLNSEWNSHVGATGVNCFTCHRGQPVPGEIWFEGSAAEALSAYAGNRGGQNQPAMAVGLTSLPADPLATYYKGEDGPDVRVVSTELFEEDLGPTIQDTEATYALMMHVSRSLGVDCVYCHNSASFQNWQGSTPQRTRAFYGIDMVRALNEQYLTPLTGRFPPERRGPGGDAPKLHCGTCHQGQARPLGGGSAVTGYPALVGDG